MLRIEQENGSYQLAVDQQIEISENNPMLSNEGSKSLPVSLPSSAHNLALLGQPHRIGRREKYVCRHKFVISQGIFRKTGTHVVFSASKTSGIQTTFYLREGEFYTEIKNITLPEIDWGAPLDPFAGSTDEKLKAWLAHFAKVMQGVDVKEYCVFPVITKYEERIQEDGSYRRSDPKIEMLNQPDYSGNIITSDKFGEIDVLPGYGATCFLRLSFVLDKIFAHFGYTLKPTLWHSDADYKKLVVLNNTADVITSGKLNYSQLVPTCEVDKFLDCVKKKFNCAFDIDEEKRSVEFSFLDAVLETKAEKDLTPYIDGEIDEVSFNEYRQIKLSAGASLSFAAPDGDSFDKFRKKYTKLIEVNESQFTNAPQSVDTVYFRKAYGAYYKKAKDAENGNVITRVSSCYFPHNKKEGKNLEDYSTDDEQVPMLYCIVHFGSGSAYSANLPCPFVGERRHENTSLKVNGVLQEAEKQNMDIMFCFAIGKVQLSATSRGETHTIDSYMGTPFEFDNKGEVWGNASLRYQGDCGLFKRFFKRSDAVMRNAFGSVNCKLHLPVSELLKLRFTKLYLIMGQPVLIYNNQYTLTNNGIVFDNTEFRTTRLLEPVSLYQDEENEGVEPGATVYYWETKSNIAELEAKHGGDFISRWLFRVYTGAKPVLPAPPTQQQFEQGGKFYAGSFGVKLYAEKIVRYRPNVGVIFTDNLQVWYEPRMFADINRVVFYWEKQDNAAEVCTKYFLGNRILNARYQYKNNKPPEITELDAAGLDDFLFAKKTAEAAYDVKLNSTTIQSGGTHSYTIADTVKIWFEARFKII